MIVNSDYRSTATSLDQDVLCQDFVVFAYRSRVLPYSAEPGSASTVFSIAAPPQLCPDRL
jgi:hypothetical protein